MIFPFKSSGRSTTENLSPLPFENSVEAADPKLMLAVFIDGRYRFQRRQIAPGIGNEASVFKAAEAAAENYPENTRMILDHAVGGSAVELRRSP